MQPVPNFDISQLTVPQRLELISALWDSLPDASEDYPAPDWHIEEIDRRVAEAKANPVPGIPWEVVKAQLKDRP